MELPNNSHKVRDTSQPPRPEKKVDQIVTGKVNRRKPPLGKRFADVFLGGDARSVWNYVVFDVLVPAAKDMVADAGSTAIERTLFGDSRGGGRRPGSRRGSSPNGYVNYNNFSRAQASQADPRTREMSHVSRGRHDFDEIILATRHEAEDVIGKMFDLINEYEQVTVADLYDLVGVTAQYQDHNWGWTDIRGSGATRIRNGDYLLDLPRPIPLKR